ncbi:hypothetical protein ACUR5C_12730 [Aliikangiella sp. IMCC44653]
MLAKPCPWCTQSIKVNQLGSRPIKSDYRWYQFSRVEKVCPYCAKPVKLAGSLATQFVGLIIPLFLTVLSELLFGFQPAKYGYLSETIWTLAGIGLLGFIWFSKFEKC